MRLLYRMIKVKMSSTKARTRLPCDSKLTYHISRPYVYCRRSSQPPEQKKVSGNELTVRTVVPIAEPTDSARRMAKRNRICVLTIRSTAVRLMGVALCTINSLACVLEYSLCTTLGSRSVSHQLRLVSREYDKPIHPLSVSQLSASQEHLAWIHWNLFAIHDKSPFVRI